MTKRNIILIGIVIFLLSCRHGAVTSSTPTPSPQQSSTANSEKPSSTGGLNQSNTQTPARQPSSANSQGSMSDELNQSMSATGRRRGYESIIASGHFNDPPQGRYLDSGIFGHSQEDLPLKPPSPSMVPAYRCVLSNPNSQDLWVDTTESPLLIHGMDSVTFRRSVEVRIMTGYDGREGIDESVLELGKNYAIVWNRFWRVVEITH